jgi:hypothetical protein
MKVPINKVDYERFKKLADLIFEEKDNKREDGDKSPSEISIYIHGGYVHLELVGAACTPEKVVEIMRA